MSKQRSRVSSTEPQRQRLPGQSPLREMQSASNKQAGPVAPPTRRSSQVSVTSSGVTSPRSSISSLRSTPVNDRRESGTAFLSRITLCQGSVDPNGTQDQVYRITKLSRLPPVTSNGLACCNDISFTRDKGRLISLRMPSKMKPGTHIILNIPLKLFCYDKFDQLTKRCLQERKFENCRVSELDYYVSLDGKKAVLLRQPFLDFDGGKACDRIDEMEVIEYYGSYTSNRPVPLSLSAGDLKIQDKTHNLFISWSTLLLADEEGGREWAQFKAIRYVPHQWDLLRSWIRAKRLVVRDVGLNSFGGPIGATLMLLKD